MYVGDEPTIHREYQFAIMPEWIVFHEGLSDRAVRLWAVLARHAGYDGSICPGRARLAALTGDCSTDSIDRAKTELIEAGALVVKHRWEPGQQLPKTQRSNEYHLVDNPPGSRTPAAINSRTRAAGVAAPVRPKREFFKEKTAGDPQDGQARAARARMELTEQRDAGEACPDCFGSNVVEREDGTMDFCERCSS